MSDVKSHATELTSQYANQVTSDLERNEKEQQRITAEIEVLQQRLQTLQGDHVVLVNLQQALQGASSAGVPAAAPQAVLHQAIIEPRSGSAAIARAKTDAPRRPAAESSAGKAAKKSSAGLTLVEVIRRYLEKQSEPRSAAEITADIKLTHPERTVKGTVVRTTLEGLVARSQAQRTKQGASVFYTSSAAGEGGAATPLQRETEAI
ncbi:hypothetical protein [Streptomyces sp. NPDC059215]|uniref:hypothetical protein n=1 Tax=Streptomyces sp. NPDC059215 TaxID=3346772 RepID=UPI0036B4A096